MEVNLSNEMISKVCKLADDSIKQTHVTLKTAIKNKESYKFRGPEYLEEQQSKINALKARIEDAKEVLEVFSELKENADGN